MVSWPKTRLCELLGIEVPIVQAPMAGNTTPELAAAVGNAGGLGSLGCAMLSPAQCTGQIEAVRRASNRPLNVNFFVHTPPEAPDPDHLATELARLGPYYDELGIEPPSEAGSPAPPFGEAALEVLLTTRPKVVSFHFGLPDEAALRALKDQGSVLMASATMVEEARWLEARGIDVVIAQGFEAGGHRGTFAPAPGAGEVGTMALVPQIVDAVRCPVIAAGGIMDGRGVAAALVLGAAGAQLGTAFLGCPEANLNPLHRDALGRATDTRVTKAFSGRPARAIANRLVQETDPGVEPLAFPLQRALTGPLAQAGSAKGSADFLAMWAGQGAPLVRRLPAGDLVRTLAAETEAALARG